MHISNILFAYKAFFTTKNSCSFLLSTAHTSLGSLLLKCLQRWRTPSTWSACHVSFPLMPRWVLLPLSGFPHFCSPSQPREGVSSLFTAPQCVLAESFLTVPQNLEALGWRPQRDGIFHTTPRVCKNDGGLLLMPPLTYSWLSTNIQASSKDSHFPFHRIYTKRKTLSSPSWGTARLHILFMWIICTDYLRFFYIGLNSITCLFT